MEPNTPEQQASQDLAKLSALALSSGGAREAKLAALKAQYEAGNLTVDAVNLATKLVDAHVKPAPGERARSSASQK